MPYSDHHMSYPHPEHDHEHAVGSSSGGIGTSSTAAGSAMAAQQHHDMHTPHHRLHDMIHIMSQPFLHHDAAVMTSIRSQYFKAQKKRIWEAPQLHRDTHLPATHLPMGIKTKYNTSRGDTWYELFFDLIFVSAAVQIGHMVQADISLEGMAYAGLLFAVMRATWDELMFYQNRFDTPDMVHYSFYLIQAMCAFTMAGHLTVEGHTGTWDKDRNLEPFVIAAALARITQSMFYYQVIRLTEAYYNHFFIMAMSQAISGVLYLGPIIFPYGWDYYHVYFLIALVVERTFTSIMLRFFTSPKTTYVAPWHMGHMIHREGTFILLILGEAIIQLVQNPGTLDASDIIRGLMGFAVVFNIGDVYHQQQIVEKHEFKVNHKVAPINLWITGHSMLSLCMLFFAAGVKLVYDDENTSSERRQKEEFIMCIFASISLNLIYLLRMQYKGICYGDSLRYGAYGFRIGLSTLIAFIPNMTSGATESVGVLFTISFLLVIQELIYRYLRELEFDLKQQRAKAAKMDNHSHHINGNNHGTINGDATTEPLLGPSVHFGEDMKHYVAHPGAVVGGNVSNPMIATTTSSNTTSSSISPTAATSGSHHGNTASAVDEFSGGIAHALSNHHLEHMQRKPAAGAIFRQESRQDSGDYEGKNQSLEPIML